MSKVQIYMKPRPVTSAYRPAKYLPFQIWSMFADYETIPFDLTEYTVRSPDLSAGIAGFHNELVPSLEYEVSEISCSSRLNLKELARMEAKYVSHFLLKGGSHVSRLYQGNHILPRATEDDPESCDALFFSILTKYDVESCADVDVATEMGMFVWALCMHYMVYYFGCHSCLVFSFIVPWYKFERDLHHPKVVYIIMTPSFHLRVCRLSSLPLFYSNSIPTFLIPFSEETDQ
ncbi:hypothetical protein IW261DRAFT_1573203 [Armillaria novae-zelandiae]|uniref:Uncharacterized protein n=1 Tax=Armillaria novae-zelandiae TaxID=153914 RepID=A0AA39NSA4_9AGAR|nr:hypothetical protein IW261DRAFT_1573203 [Armillaria novae-zelandiae]